MFPTASLAREARQAPLMTTHSEAKPALTSCWSRAFITLMVLAMVLSLGAAPLSAQPEHRPGGEANLVMPDLNQATFLDGIGGRTLLMIGLVVSGLGMLFGLMIYMRLKAMPVHKSMLEVSELIYATCKTYLQTQGKFLMILEVFIGVIIIFYFGVLLSFDLVKVVIILLFSVIGILGSYGVAAFGIRVNTFANSRAASSACPLARRCAMSSTPPCVTTITVSLACWCAMSSKAACTRAASCFRLSPCSGSAKCGSLALKRRKCSGWRSSASSKVRPWK